MTQRDALKAATNQCYGGDDKYPVAQRVSTSVRIRFSPLPAFSIRLGRLYFRECIGFVTLQVTTPFIEDDPVTTGQLGALLGVTHQRVDEMIRRSGDFPKTDVTLRNGTCLSYKNVAFKWFQDHPRRAYRRSNVD